MGRCYSGDIEGKFMFAVQSSEDADFFGGDRCEPNYIEYYFDEANLSEIKEGLDKCKKALGKYKKIIDDFFAQNDTWTDERMAEALKLSEKESRKMLVWWARQELGEKIYNCVKKNGSCQFEAEL